MRVLVLKPIRLKSEGGKPLDPGDTFDMPDEKMEKARPYLNRGLMMPVPSEQNHKCRSFRYDEDEGVKDCGKGWLCGACQNHGEALITVLFWSDKVPAVLNLTMPEKDLYGFQKVMAARKAREKIDFF